MITHNSSDASKSETMKKAIQFLAHVKEISIEEATKLMKKKVIEND